MNHRRTEIYTLTTDVFGESQLFITAESWIQVKLRLETAGPVAVSTRDDIVPVLSGRGGLVNEDDMVFVLNKGDRLFYTAQAINRVRVIIEPIPDVGVTPVDAPQVPGPVQPRPEQPKQPASRRRPSRWP